MSIIWRKSLLFTLLVFFIPATYAAQPKDLFFRGFWQPYYNGQRLAYCTLDQKECGLPVADRYCKMMGYERADKQSIANNIGLSNYISSTAQCVGWRCNGFKAIRCTSKISHKPPKSWHYRLRRFVFPRFNNYRVDWCYDGQKGCGHRAAYSFCRHMGYMNTRQYSIQKGITATQAIGNQKLCFGQQCRAFAAIDCFR